MIAVPDIRLQCAGLAKELLRRLAHGPGMRLAG